ncbi:hypothetical protein JW898_02860 [Candidatus Woesearchaeota archaeon]|nr:hypothetical protein [Candidatus Woesearchaeota archaeon]
MAIVGFEFTKINVQRQEVAKGKINISNNVGITDIKKSDLQLGKSKQNGIRFFFEYRSSYEPGFAKIELGGIILYLTDEKNAKEITEAWEKEKKIKKDVAEKIINAILTKCNIQSIILSNTVNLPPPVPMPHVNVATGPKQEPAKEGKREEKKEDRKERQESLKK